MQEVLGCLLALRLSRPHSGHCTKSLLFCGMLSYRLRIETQPFDATIPKLAKTSENPVTRSPGGVKPKPWFSPSQNLSKPVPKTTSKTSPKPLRKLGKYYYRLLLPHAWFSDVCEGKATTYCRSLTLERCYSDKFLAVSMRGPR